MVDVAKNMDNTPPDLHLAVVGVDLAVQLLLSVDLDLPVTLQLPVIDLSLPLRTGTDLFGHPCHALTNEHCISMQFLEFQDYVQCKAFDVISGDGSYRRYLYQCVEKQDEWALRMHANVAKVTGYVREVQQLVDRVRQLQTPLARVCTEVVTAMHAPVRVVPRLAVCSITGAHSQDCIDVSRATKTENPVLVHPRFHYFFLMLYYIHRLEHVVRSFTKSWLEEQDPDLTMAELTKSFAAQEDLMRSMHRAFVEGSQHVVESLQHYLCS